jgi:O-antigen/teichoic acid export membrane protein
MPPGDPQPTVSGPGSLEARAARGATWSAAGFVGGQLVRLVGNTVVAGLLFEEAFGLMALVLVFITGLQLFSDIGIGPSIIQNERGDDQVFVNTAFTLQAVRGVLLWVASCLGALPFATFYGQPQLAQLIPVVGFTAALQGLNSTKLFTANRHLAMGRLTLIELASQVVAVVAMIVWAVVSPSVWALVAGAVASAVAKLVLSHLALPGIGNRLQWEARARTTLLHFGRWIFLSTLLMFLAGQSDRLIFGKLVDIGTLGVYSIAVMLASFPAMGLGTLTGKIVFPLFSRVHNEGGDLPAAYRRVRWPLLMLSGWASAGLIAGGPTIVRLIYDDRYLEAGWMLQIVAVGAWFGVLLEGTNGSALLARGLARWTAAGSGGKLLGLVAFIPLGHALAGFPGAVAGAAAAELLRYLISLYAAQGQRFRALDQDALLTAVVLGSGILGWFAGGAVRQRGFPQLAEAAVVFAAVSAAWLPLGLPFLARRRPCPGIDAMKVNDFFRRLRRVNRHTVKNRLAEAREDIEFHLRAFADHQEQRFVGRLVEASSERHHPRRDVHEIPVIINSRNRLTPLLALIDALERAGTRNIFILDNDSTYPPLLRYFESTRHRVLHHGANRGPYGFWDSPFWRLFRNDFYVYTDPDVVPCEDCPNDFMQLFYDTLRADKALGKVGFGLRIDDLPDYVDKTKVIGWEKIHWDKPVNGVLYDAPIDTTFALYRPRARGGFWCRAYRTGAPYLARHMPWYSNPNQPTEEDEFYARTASSVYSHYNTSSQAKTSWGHSETNPGMKWWRW